MTLEAWFTIAVVAGVIAALVTDRLPPVAAVLGGVVVLVLGGVLPVEAAFAGFSNPATITIAALLVISRAAQQTGVLTTAVNRLLSQAGDERQLVVRLSAATAAVSSVVANTPIVATLAPSVRSWCERNGRSVSRLLMPLSFAAILGGVVTTIGTSTTLLVSGLLDAAGLGGLGLLEITPVGLPLAAAGTAALALLAPRLLPDRRDPVAQVASAERDYTFQMRVEPGGALEGANVRTAGLRSLEGVFLARILRDGREIAPVSPDTTLEGSDVLTFVGRVDRVRDLTARAGLKSVEGQHVDLLTVDRHSFYEAVVGADSPLAGRTPKEVSFRGRYGAAIVAIHRSGQRVAHKLGEVRLSPGDALLLLADPDFDERWANRRDFLLVVPLDDEEAASGWRGVFVLLVLAAALAAAAVGLLSLAQAALAAVLAILVARVLDLQQTLDALDPGILLVVAGAFGLGAAVEASGLASVLAAGFSAVAAAAGGVAALAAVFVGVLILTELVSNVAAAGIMLPVALEVAARVGADPRGFAVAVAVAASSSFLTPIGYQTNTIVYGMGGYRYGDYWRLGLPLTLLTTAVTLAVVPAVWEV